MKRAIWLIGLFVAMSCQNTARIPADVAKQYPLSLQIGVENPLSVQRNDVLVKVSLSDLRSAAEGFNPDAFVAYAEGKELPVQSIDLNGDGAPDEIGILIDMAPVEKRDVDILYAKNIKLMHEYTKRTQAELSVKKGGKWEGSNYVGGTFKNVSYLRVPPQHTDHSTFIRYEGPGWESDKVAYRFYLDWRNATDIFGKKTADMVLQNVGQEGIDTYEQMSDWGADIFKVGNSLGIGAIGMWHENKVKMVSVVDSVTSQIADNGAIYSEILTKYHGWQVGTQKYEMTSALSIAAGKRLTRHQLTVNPNVENLCTGLAKHPGTVYLKSDSAGDGQWQYFALWGNQTLFNDSLGIAVLYRASDLLQMTEDSLSYVALLRPTNGHLTYYFLAAWDQEPGGITTQDAFRKYLNETIQKLDDPVRVTL